MGYYDNAEIADVINATVHTIKAAAHQISNADRRISAEQIARIEEAIQALQRSLKLKKGSSKASRT